MATKTKNSKATLPNVGQVLKDLIGITSFLIKADKDIDAKAETMALPSKAAWAKLIEGKDETEIARMGEEINDAAQEALGIPSLEDDKEKARQRAKLGTARKKIGITLRASAPKGPKISEATLEAIMDLIMAEPAKAWKSAPGQIKDRLKKVVS